MEKIAALIEAWDEAHWAFTLAFEGLADQDLWLRPHPRLLSVGELAGHVAYNEASLAEGGTVQSPLVDKRFSYYDDLAGNPVRLCLTVQQVLDEVTRAHEAAKAGVAQVQRFDEVVPWRDDLTWYQIIQYRVFHVAYHCGQAYSVRHLLGHGTTDN
jgi:hypothetical protein